MTEEIKHQRPDEALAAGYRVYNDSLRDLANNSDMTPEQRQAAADAAYNEHVERTQKLGAQWSEAVAARAQELRAKLYHGDGGYIQEVRRLSTLPAEELKAAASLARKTQDEAGLRAVATVAHERGEFDVFGEYLDSNPEMRDAFQELHSLMSVEDREMFVQQFVPDPPRNIRPTPEAPAEINRKAEWDREEERRRIERERAEERRRQRAAAPRMAFRVTSNK